MGLDLMDRLMGSDKTQGQREGLERADEYGRDLSWRRNAANNAQYKKMVENIMMGKEAQLGVMQQTYPQYADILQGGYRSATGTTQGGLEQSIAARVGGNPDLSFLDYQPQQQPDLSFLKDFKMPNFKTDRPQVGTKGGQQESSATSGNKFLDDEAVQRLMEG